MARIRRFELVEEPVVCSRSPCIEPICFAKSWRETGSIPSMTVYAVKPGRPVTYQGTIGKVMYLGIKDDLFFGYTAENGLQIASPEKALLDTLYYYQKGRTFYFNIYADVSVTTVNKKMVREYLNDFSNQGCRYC